MNGNWAQGTKQSSCDQGGASGAPTFLLFSLKPTIYRCDVTYLIIAHESNFASLT